MKHVVFHSIHTIYLWLKHVVFHSSIHQMYVGVKNLRKAPYIYTDFLVFFLIPTYFIRLYTICGVFWCNKLKESPLYLHRFSGFFLIPTYFIRLYTICGVFWCINLEESPLYLYRFSGFFSDTHLF